MLRSLLAALQARIGLLLGRGLDSRSGPFFAFLRTFVPFARTGPFLLVTRDNDVREVLARREQFTVAQYGNKMEQITGPFILGMDDIDMYRHDHTALRRVMGVDDLDRVKHLVSTHADELILHALPTGRVDVVEIADQVLVRTVGEYFGTPGPDEATMLRWSKILFQEIFLNVQNDPAVHAEAMAAAAQMCEYLDESIAARKEQMARGDHGPDDVLGRLLSAQGREPPFLEDRAIRHNLLGLIVGWIPTVSKAVTLAVEELLRRPRELGAAQSAARRNDDDELALYLFEALRFRPHNVGLLRTCAVDAALAVGQRRETTVPAGAQVFAMTQSAMFDPDTIPAPREFRLDRPWGDYLHFGYGLHTCFGEQLNRVQIPALGRALLRHGPVARAKGRAGRLSWSGPYPRSLVLRMAPSQLGSVPTTSGERSPDRADDAMREEARET